MAGALNALDSSAPTPPIPPPAPRLALRGISKTYPGLIALDHVNLTLRTGDIHALMGENGAGKSTLIKVLTGAELRDAGTIALDGVPINPNSPAQAHKLGISTVYQDINLVPDLSIAENLFLGRQPMKFGCIDWKAIHRGATAALARLNLRLDLSRPLGSCSIAIQQMVAIARALDVSARVLVLDEPTSSLDADETDRLFQIMRRLQRQGLAILFVTHFIDQAYAVADRITVLRNGRLIGEYRTADLPRVELITKMIGRELPAATNPRPPKPQVGEQESKTQEHEVPAGHNAHAVSGTAWLQARSLGRKGSIHPLDLDIFPGEVVGLAGLLGSGRTETARLLFGLDRADSGTLRIGGKHAALISPRRAITLGLGMLPEDRQTQGILPNLSLRENIVLALQARRGWWRPVRRARQHETAARFIQALGISTTDAEKPIRLLSGGNQQKAILARWLATQPPPRLLILDEPTRGIDVGAKAQIEALVHSLCRGGMAILFISSELDEVLRLSDRVAVLRDRAKIAEFDSPRTTGPGPIMRLLAAGGDG